MPPIIAFDADVIGRQRTGDETVATGLLTAIAARTDLDFQVLAYVRDVAKVPEAITESGVVRPVAVDIGSNYRRVAVSLPARLRADRPALFHGNYVLPPGLPCPGVVTVHDSSYRFAAELMPKADALAFGRIVPWSMRRAARVVTVSEHARLDVLKSLPALDPAKVIAIPNGVSAAYAPDPTAADRVRAAHGLEPGYVLFIGALQPRKNLLRLLEAYARVRDTRGAMPPLVLVGNTKQDHDELAERITKLGLADVVHRVGYVEGEAALRDLYAAAGVFAFPSLYEGFGLPIAEAMACGTPVLAADATALPEVAGGAAVLVDPLSVSAIATGLATLLDDESVRERCRTAGLVRAAELTWTAAADRLVAVWQKVLAESPQCQRAVRSVAAGEPASVVAALTSTGQADDLPDAIAGLRQQEMGEALTIVVVANRPGDGTAELIRADYPDCVLVEQPDTRSYAENQAVAFAAAPGNYLAIVNPDAIAQLDCLPRLVRFMEEHPRCGLVAPTLRNLDGSYQEAARNFPEPIGSIIRRTPLRKLLPPSRFAADHYLGEPDSARQVDWSLGAFLLIRREAWDDVGGFDEAFAPLYVEEIELQWRLWQRGWEIWQEPAAEVVHAHQAASDGAFFDKRTVWHLRNVGRFIRRHPTVLAGQSPGLAPSNTPH
jgi:glycosyltransferase involved in cell wall biosynthesis/GT2 family glycosyltransferase